MTATILLMSFLLISCLGDDDDDENIWNEFNTSCKIGENNCVRCDKTTGLCAECAKGYYYESRDGYCYSTIFYNCEHWTGSGDVNDPLAYPNGSCPKCITDHHWPDPNPEGNHTCQPDGTKCRESMTFGYEYCNKFVDSYRESNYTSGRCYCESCIEGAYLIQYSPTPDKDSCYLCSEMPRCVKCSSTMNQCVECEKGYFPEDNMIMGTDGTVRSNYCEPVSLLDNCKVCETTAKKCAKCKEGYFRGENGICYLCSVMFCAPNKCSGKERVCTECLSTYYPDKNGRCVKITPIANCVTISTVERKCVECSTGFYPDFSGHCYPCGNINGCSSCNTKNKECTTCATGHYLDEDKLCYECEDMGCRANQCTANRKSCNSCMDGYTGVKNGDDTTCELTKCQGSAHSIANCGKYSIVGVEDDYTCVCTRCKFNHILVGQTCMTKDYIPYCVQISHHTQGCIECEEGYYPHHQNCHLCEDIVGCVKCMTTNNQCIQCDDGYYLTDEATCDACTKLSPNCILCSSITRRCSICEENYYLTENLTCSNSSPIDNCEILHQDQIVKCRKCTHGYFPDQDGRCYSCDTMNCSAGECSPYERICMNCIYVHPEPPVQRFRYNVVLKTCNVLACAIRNCMVNEQLRSANSAGRSGYFCHRCLPGFMMRPQTSDVIDVLYNDKGKYERCFSCNRLPYCLECDQRQWEVCTRCIEGYFLETTVIVVKNVKTYTYACKLCSTGIENCELCSQLREECMRCVAGYYVVADGEGKTVCVSCGEKYSKYCEECNSDGCTHCGQGSYWKDKECIECTTIENCVRCSPSSGNCFECKDGYVAVKGACVTCPVGCKPGMCDAVKGICYDCEEGTFPNSSGECIPCTHDDQHNPVDTQRISNCKTCSTTERYCYECMEGTTPFDGVCYPCSFIPNCSYDACLTYKNYCLDCSTGYYTSNGSCIECTQLPNCAANGCRTDQEFCHTCKEGYLADGNGGCTACNGCVACSGSLTYCTKCADMHYVKNGSCIPCGDGVSKCSSCDGVHCLSCQNEPTRGKYFDVEDDDCKECQDPCINCTSLEQCSTCIAGHYMKPNTLTGAVNCEQCGGEDICQTCPSGTCTSCSDTYYVSGGACQKCRTPCDTCSDASNCQQCISGYYRKESGTCTLCQRSGQEKCVACSESVCTLCSDGYYLRTRVVDLGLRTQFTAVNCDACSTTCKTCENGASAQNCLTCATGYFMARNMVSGGKVVAAHCEKCGKDLMCISCSDDVCTHCMDGYYLAGGDCILCSTNCKTCSDENTCLSCNDGMYITPQEKCALCNGNSNANEPCVRCSRSTCTRCQDAYSLSNGQCLDCQTDSPLCDECVNNVCERCVTGYYLTGNKGCLPCKEETSLLGPCNECEQIYSTFKCLKCQASSSDQSNFVDGKKTVPADGLMLITQANANVKCFTCSSLRKNCIECEVTETNNVGKCITCVTGGFFVNTLGNCIRCNLLEDTSDPSESRYCSKCTSEYDCSECEEADIQERPLYLNKAQVCSVCPGYSSGCLACEEGTGYCTSCPEGKVKTEGSTQCRGCDFDNCMQCNDTNLYCTQCAVGLVWDSDLSQCTECGTKWARCIQCGSDNNCAECEEGYIPINGPCNNCSYLIPNCVKCMMDEESAKCTECKEPFTLNSKGECEGLESSRSVSVVMLIFIVMLTMMF